jgi:hypothetical protein
MTNSEPTTSIAWKILLLARYLAAEAAANVTAPNLHTVATLVAVVALFAFTGVKLVAPDEYRLTVSMAMAISVLVALAGATAGMSLR